MFGSEIKYDLPLLKIFLFLGILIPWCALLAQEPDSTHSDRVQELQSKLDSLQKAINILRTENKNGQDFPQDTLIVYLNSTTEAQDDTSERIDDQRSRRKRLDELLELYMKRPGVINFNGDATAVIQGTFTDKEKIATGTGSFDLFVASRLGKQTLLFINLEAIGGNGPNENFNSLTTLNEDAGSTKTADRFDRMHVLEAWVEFSALGETAKFTAGKIDITNYFDNNAVANDETSQFISGIFVNSPALPIPGNTPGIRLRAELKRKYFFQFAAISNDNSGNRLFDDLFKIASTGFHFHIKKNLRGTYRLYAYLQGNAKNAKGYGLSIDQPIGMDITLFGRWNYNDKELTEYLGIESSWSTGGQFKADILGNSFTVGLAYGVVQPGNGALMSERILEAYYRQQLNSWTYISPHIQYVDNAAGLSDNLLIVGLRTQFNF